MLLLKQEECGYNKMKCFQISAEKLEYMNANYQGREIGRGSSGAWPVRSPDLTLFDFLMW